jgi:hypothetical protein
MNFKYSLQNKLGAEVAKEQKPKKGLTMNGYAA